MSFHVYLTDALKAIAENGANHFIPGYGFTESGVTMRTRWRDIVDDTPVIEDTRTCAEIVSGIWSKIRGETK